MTQPPIRKRSRAEAAGGAADGRSKPVEAVPGKKTARSSRTKQPRPALAEGAAEATISRLTRQLATARGQLAKLRARADTDFLLDIPNRRGFARELRRALAYVKRYETSAALMVMDVDGLKPVNDGHGHAAGDRMLKFVAGVLSSSIRESDTLARLGGDEFAILLWNLSLDDAHAKATALEDKVSAEIFEYRGERLPVAISAGVTLLLADDDPDSVFERADQEMYARKQQKRPRRKTRVRR